MARSTLTVFFENPFWVGIYERIDDDRYEVCKITFGAEPKDYEVWDFLLKNWSELKFSPPTKAERVEERKINPKRMQREIHSKLQEPGIGTKAQQALKLQHEQNKLERKTISREQREAEKERQYELRQQKSGTNIVAAEWSEQHGKTRLDFMPGVRQQNTPANTVRYRTDTLSSILSQV